MKIRVNGEVAEVNNGITVRDLVVFLNIDPKGVAVERNLEIVPRSLHIDTVLAEGDKLEVVEFVGGG